MDRNKFYLETYGCKSNQADSNFIRAQLTKKFNEASEDEADFIIINSCGVIGKTKRKIVKRIKKFKKTNKKIILAGCLPIISPEVVKLVDGAIGPQNITSINKVAKEVLSGRKPKIVESKETDKSDLCLSRKEKESCVAIVPIAEGCLGECSYCAAKFARGKVNSFSGEKIKEKIERAVNKGFKEIQLTSQDNACYGADQGSFSLPDLLNEILSIKADFKIKIGMMNPQHAKRILPELISLYEDERIYKFLHLPLQSGDDSVLERMKRNYKVEDFLEVASEFRNSFENLLLATDVICGFPEESEDSFQKTKNVIKEISPSILHITRFSSRPETEASKMKDFPSRIKKERSRELHKLSRKMRLEENEKFLNKELKVLVTRKGKGSTYISRPQFYKAVILNKGRVGEEHNVKIRNYEDNYLEGEII